MSTCFRVLACCFLFSFSTNALCQFVFQPGSVWQFDGSDIGSSGPYSYYIELTATDKDSLFNGTSWQIMEWHSEFREEFAVPVSVNEGQYLYRREGNHLVQAFKGDPTGERFHPWHVDAAVGDTLYYDIGGPFPITTLPHTEVIEVDTVFESGILVQQLTLVQTGFFNDTLVVQPWTGVLQRQQSIFVNEHIGSELSIYPFVYNLVDIGHLQLTCFTFPDGTNVHYRKDCGKLINSIDPSDINGGSSFFLFPNPFHDQLYLQWPQDIPFQVGVRLVMTHPSGVVVYEDEVQDPGRQVYSLNLGQLPASMYIIQIVQENGSPLWTSKVIKN